jgi:hypothetical protein
MKKLAILLIFILIALYCIIQAARTDHTISCMIYVIIAVIVAFVAFLVFCDDKTKMT